jgi:hypothetical protein
MNMVRAVLLTRDLKLEQRGHLKRALREGIRTVNDQVRTGQVLTFRRDLRERALIVGLTTG